ncbi:2-aminoethylphosphonate aminotransferase [Pantoea stewartii]|uniref:2-aminoethylphosphonate aminotransferase n=1 Tax=Pantoea stewartii TaxID=66269 RepID=UPI00249EDCE0|nr:2-aminoethylphosphonate--pyruvate transaminase [Pantoea stewartii]
MRPLRLFTPGPLNTSERVRQAAGIDLGSRSPMATTLSAQLQRAVAGIAGCNEQWCAIPLQGSGTFAVEAMLCSLIGTNESVLVLENGIYSQRIASICALHAISHRVLSFNAMKGFDLEEVEAALQENPEITYIAAVHFETALGVLNDISGLITLAQRYRREVLVDAISTFGVLPLDFTQPSLRAIALSSNKGLHGLPGLAFVLTRRTALSRKMPARTLSLDLNAQFEALEQDGQWRFTPPLQIMLALQQAIAEFHEQGGRAARYKVYQQRMEYLLQGMASLGFTPIIDAEYRAPLIVTLAPQSEVDCDISRLNDYLFERQLVIYPTKHSNPNSFRVGVMGELSLADIDDLLVAFSMFISGASSLQMQASQGDAL